MVKTLHTTRLQPLPCFIPCTSLSCPVLMWTCLLLTVPSACGLWAPWSTCSAPCDGGIQTRRSCSGWAAGSAAVDAECQGPHSQTRDCNTQPCTGARSPPSCSPASPWRFDLSLAPPSLTSLELRETLLDFLCLLQLLPTRDQVPAVARGRGPPLASPSCQQAVTSHLQAGSPLSFSPQPLPSLLLRPALSSHPAQCPGDMVFCSAEQCHKRGGLCSRLCLAQGPGVECTSFCAPGCTCPPGLFLHNASFLPCTWCPCQMHRCVYEPGAVAHLNSCNNW